MKRCKQNEKGVMQGATCLHHIEKTQLTGIGCAQLMRLDIYSMHILIKRQKESERERASERE